MYCTVPYVKTTWRNDHVDDIECQSLGALDSISDYDPLTSTNSKFVKFNWWVSPQEKTSIHKCRAIIKCVTTNKYLVVHQTASNNWGFAGGTMELNEEPEDCCSRELVEEIKYYISPDTLKTSSYMTIGKFDRVRFYKHFVNNEFKCTVDMIEIDDYKWMTLQEISFQKLATITKIALKNLRTSFTSKNYQN